MHQCVTCWCNFEYWIAPCVFLLVLAISCSGCSSIPSFRQYKVCESGLFLHMRRCRQENCFALKHPQALRLSTELAGADVLIVKRSSHKTNYSDRNSWATNYYVTNIERRDSQTQVSVVFYYTSPTHLKVTQYRAVKMVQLSPSLRTSVLHGTHLDSIILLTASPISVTSSVSSPCLH